MSFKCPKCNRFVKGTKLNGNDTTEEGFCDNCDLLLTAEFSGYVDDSGIYVSRVYVYNKKQRIYKTFRSVE